MSKHIYQKINWKDYSKFWNKNFPKHISEIKKHFDNKDKKFRKLNIVFYKSYFYFSVSQIIFLNYLNRKKIFQNEKKIYFKKTVLKILKRKVIEYKLLNRKNFNYQNKIINFKFFHRHYAFEKKFIKLKQFKTINFDNYSYHKYIKLNENDYKNFSFVSSDDLISEIITLEKNFDKFIKCKYPKVLMISGHSYANNSLNRLFISFSKILNSRIFVYQCNFLQGLLDYFNFNKYEEIVSDIYFSTGKNLNIKNYINLGSFYSYKHKLSKKNKMNKKNLVVLLQPPYDDRDFPMQMSMDYSNTISEYKSVEKDIFLNLKKIVLENKNCDFLSKDVSYEYYFKKFKQYKLKLKSLKKSYLNNPKKINDYNYKNVFFTYPSNALVDYFYAGSKIILSFPQNFIFFKNIILKKHFFSEKKILQIIRTYAKETNPNKVYKILNKYF